MRVTWMSSVIAPMSLAAFAAGQTATSPRVVGPRTDQQRPANIKPTLTDRIVPRKLYNGVGRSFHVTVTSPAAGKGTVEIRLLAAVTGAEEAKATVPQGDVDLAKIFPSLWTKKSPTLLYAQIFANGKPVGAALVLQPILNPVISRLKEDKKTVEFVPDEDGPMYNGIRAYPDQHLVLDTTFGQIEFRLRPDAAPNTTFIIRELVKGGYYTDTLWHRVVAKRPKDGNPFVVQGGDPTGTGSGGPGFAYPLEQSPLPHDFGVLGIARSTDPNTNGGQIYIALSREGTQHLDGRYATFAQAIRGSDAILKIAAVPVGANDRPTTPPKIITARLVDAPPYPNEMPPLTRPAAK